MMIRSRSEAVNPLSRPQLPAHDAFGLARFALLKRLADAHNGRQTGAKPACVLRLTIASVSP